MTEMDVIHDTEENHIELNLEGDGRIEIHYDKYTGDWGFFDTRKKYPQVTYFRDKDSAVKYAMQAVGLLDDAEYEEAPTRVDA